MGEAKRRSEHTRLHDITPVYRPVKDIKQINMEVSKVQPQMQVASNPQDIFTHLQGKTVISFLQEDFDCCYDLSESFQILTNRGWKEFNDITFEDMVATLNIETEELEYQKITDKYLSPEMEWDLYSLKSQAVEGNISPKHNFIVKDRKGKLKFIDAKKALKRHSTYRIPLTANWRGNDKEFKEFKDGTKIKMEDWIAFLGLYLAEGFASGVESKIPTKTRLIVITQQEGEKLNKIRELLKRIPTKNGWKEKQSNRSKQIFTSNPIFFDELFVLGTSHEKYIPGEIKNLTSQKLQILIEWMMLGDGSNQNQLYKKHNYSFGVYYTVSKKLADDFQEILIKIGKNGRIHPYISRGYKAGQAYKIWIVERKYAKFQSEKKTFLTPIKKLCKIGCITVPNHTFMVRVNGKAYWTGNCSEKVILEYTPLFNQDNIAILMVPKKNFTDVLKYLSNIVVHFRMGHKPDADVGFTRQLLSYMTHLRGLGIRQVYYVDDFLFLSNRKAPLAYISGCNAVIVSNQILKDYLTTTVKMPQPVIIVPTHIDLDTFDTIQPLEEYKSDRFKVLMTSQGRIGINYLYEMCEIINEDPSMYKDIEFIINASQVAQIRSVINKFRNVKKRYLDWIPLRAYYGLAKSVDVLIHPARGDDLAYMCPPELQKTWLDSKSEVKYTVAGAAKIPLISSPTYSYKMAIVEGQTGFIANSTEEFVETIRMLKDNKELCKQVGENVRLDIENNYDIKQRYPLYRDAILGQLDQRADVLVKIEKPQNKKYVFLPPGEGGPRSFYENMREYLPKVSNNEWEITTVLDNADVAIAVAFIFADAIIERKTKNPNLKVVYRLDGLPTDYKGDIEPVNLAAMQRMFRRADIQVWQSKHCLNKWRDARLVPPEITPGGPIIPNGVDLSTFTPEGQKYAFPGMKKYNFLHLNWSTFPHKRLDILKDLIKKYEENKDIHFYLLGNYIDSNQIHNMTFWKDFPNVTYVGVMKNQSRESRTILASIYRAVTALIFTSEMEGSPNSALEAIGCACPIIYNSQSDIIPELLGDACISIEQMDKIFDENDRQEIIKKMKIIAPSYGMEECVKKYLEVFRNG